MESVTYRKPAACADSFGSGGSVRGSIRCAAWARVVVTCSPENHACDSLMRIVRRALPKPRHGMQFPCYAFRAMKKIFLTVLLLCLTACSAPAPVNTTPTATRYSTSSTSALPQPTGSQSFDYYLLNLSWSPEFCYSHQSAPECGKGATFVLHGLWPQNAEIGRASCRERV